MDKREKRTINRFVLYEAIADDLVFWVLIDTLFLTSVKGLTVAEVSGVTFASCLMFVALYFPFRRLISKIGELNSMKIGACLFLATALLFTFGTHLLTFAVASFLYQSAYSFQTMAFSYIRNYLISMDREEEYARLFARADRLYSTVTLVLAMASGFLFNISPYIPMAICIFFCICTLVLVFTFKDLPHDSSVRETRTVPGRRQERLERNALRCAIVIAVFIATSGIAFSNLKLLYQGRAEAFFPQETAVFLFSAVVMANRAARIALSFFSAKVSSWEPFRKRAFQAAPILVAAALLLAVLGSLLDSAVVSLALIGVGVVASNAALMPMCVVLRQWLLSCSGSPQKSLLFEGFIRRIISMLASGCLCLMLGVLSLPQCLVIMAAALAVLAFIFARWGKEITRKSSRFYYLNWMETNPIKSGDFAKSRKVLAKHYGVYDYMLAANPACKYSFDRLKKSYMQGKPCAVIIDDTEKEAWRPVIYLDEDGFVLLDEDKHESVHLKTDSAKLLTTFDVLDEGAFSMKMSSFMDYLRKSNP